MTKNVIKIQHKVKERLVFDLGTRTRILPMESALEMSCQGNACQGAFAVLKQKDEDEVMDEPKLKQKLNSPMLPFQSLSSFLSSAIWLLVSEVWRECTPVAAAMEGTDRAGRRLALSAFPGSFRDRC